MTEPVLTRLEDMCALVIDCPHFTPEWTDAGFIVLRNQNIRDGRLNLSSPSYTNKTDFDRRNRRAQPQKGDIVFTREAPMGEVCMIPDGLECCLGQRQVLLRPRSDVNGKYLFYALQSAFVRHQIMWNEGTGSTVSNVRIPVLKDLKIPRIEGERDVGETLAALDEKIELNRKMNETLEAMARALFRDWFIDFGPIRAKMAGRPAYLSEELWPLFPDRLDDEGKPSGWTKKPLTDFLSIIGGGTPKTSIDQYWNGSIPWFSVADTPPSSSVFVTQTEKTITDAGLADSSARLVVKGTTIITARGTVGNLAIAGRDMTFNQSCYGLQGVGLVGKYFVFLVAQHMVGQLQSMAHGSVFSTITRQTFEAVEMPMASEPIFRAFETIVSDLFERILLSVEESQTLAQTRNLLLPRLMSGELKLSELVSA